jgi:hypothetical protein
MTPPKCVRYVAFFRPQSNRRSQGCCTSLDTEFSNRQEAYDLGSASQEETILGGRPTAGRNEADAKEFAGLDNL